MKNYFRFEITEEIKELVKNCIKDMHDRNLKELGSYFNGKICKMIVK